jgi:hypothetical protein
MFWSKACAALIGGLFTQFFLFLIAASVKQAHGMTNTGPSPCQACAVEEETG